METKRIILEGNAAKVARLQKELKTRLNRDKIVLKEIPVKNVIKSDKSSKVKKAELEKE